MKKLALLFLCLPLAACGYDIYQKPGLDKARFASDQIACQGYAREQPPSRVLERPTNDLDSDNLAVAQQRQDDVRSCLESKGYTLEHSFGLRRSSSL